MKGTKLRCAQLGIRGGAAMSLFNKTDSPFYDDETSGFATPMADVARRQFTASLIVLVLALAAFSLFHVFHYIVA